MIQYNCPRPQTSPDYITMVASPQQAKQPVKEVRRIMPEKKKMPTGWLKCLKRSHPKITFRNNDIYNTVKTENHHYEKPKGNDNRVFINMQGFVQNNIQREDVNHESVEEKETTI